jgi:hypothetical protein
MRTLLVLLLFIPQISLAVCLDENGNPYRPPLALKFEYTHSDAVLLVTPLRVKQVPENNIQGDPYGDGGEIYTLRVDEVLKGTPSESFEVFSGNNSGRFPMSVGSQYIVFVNFTQKPYAINSCGNSGLVSVSESLISSLQKLIGSVSKPAKGDLPLYP